MIFSPGCVIRIPGLFLLAEIFAAKSTVWLPFLVYGSESDELVVAANLKIFCPIVRSASIRFNVADFTVFLFGAFYVNIHELLCSQHMHCSFPCFVFHVGCLLFILMLFYSYYGLRHFNCVLSSLLSSSKNVPAYARANVKRKEEK